MRRCRRMRSRYSVNEGDRLAAVSPCIGNGLRFLGNAIACIYTKHHKVCSLRSCTRLVCYPMPRPGINSGLIAEVS
ncbi:MAG: hypothetical protein HC833_06890 [Leptolyngbyaceae cyanobacterium RM1_406_9]|nr:hypothetical protein [Leptolyngbyaceae cyanobacterium RM1_406_9]